MQGEGNNLLLSIDVSHKILRKDLVLDVMYDMYERSRGNFHDECSKKLIGQIVLTRQVAVTLFLFCPVNCMEEVFLIFLFHGSFEIGKFILSGNNCKIIMLFRCLITQAGMDKLGERSFISP